MPILAGTNILLNKILYAPHTVRVSPCAWDEKRLPLFRAWPTNPIGFSKIRNASKNTRRVCTRHFWTADRQQMIIDRPFCQRDCCYRCFNGHVNRFRCFSELELKTLMLKKNPPTIISKTFYTLKFIKHLDFSHEFIYRAYRFLPQTQWPLIFIVICPRVFLPVSILIVLFWPLSSDNSSFAVQQQRLFPVDVFKK